MTLRNNTEKTKKTPDFRRPFVYDFKASLFCGITRRAFRKRQTAPRFLTVHTFCLQNIRLHCFTKRRLSLRENYLLSNIPSCFVQKKERILCMRSYFVQLCFSAVNFYVHRLSVDCDGEIFVDGIQLTVYFCRFFVLSVLFLLRFQLLLHYRKHRVRLPILKNNVPFQNYVQQKH